jgi:hypothetical protein
MYIRRREKANGISREAASFLAKRDMNTSNLGFGKGRYHAYCPFGLLKSQRRVRIECQYTPGWESDNIHSCDLNFEY